MIKNTKEREPNFELLRIVSMIMIIFLHFCTFNGILNNIPDYSFKYYVFNILFYICLTAVNLYVFISGYFSVESKFKFSKLIKLELEVIFYSAGIYLLLVIFGLEEFNFRHFFTDLFPIIFAKYWFITGYVFLFLLTPFLNKYIKGLTKQQFKYTLFLLFIIFVIIGTINPINRTLSISNGYSLIWMVYLYFVGAYIKLHYNKNCSGIKLLFAIFSCLTIKFALDIILKHYCYINVINSIVEAKYAYNNVFIFLESVCIFLLFKRIKIKNKYIRKLILFFGSSTLAVYLIHMNYDLYLKMWDYINPIQYLATTKIYMCAALSILTIFFCSVAIDKVRNLIFQLIFKIPFFNKLFDKLDTYTKVEES